MISLHGPDPYESMTDEDLVKKTLVSSDTYRYLVDRYSQKILRYVIRISSFDQEDAEDIVQEVFIKAYVRLREFDPKMKFGSWIYRIAHNMTIDQFRKKQARGEFSGEDVDFEILSNMIASIYDTKSALIDGERVAEVSKVLHMLEPQYREVLILSFFEEKSYEEISDILRVPIGTVGTLIHRAKKSFREKGMTVNLHLF